MKSSSSFNRSDDEDNKFYDHDDDNEVIVREVSQKEYVSPKPINRMLSNFGGIRESNQDVKRSGEVFSNTFPNKLT